MSIRNSILEFLIPITKWVGKLHAPLSHRDIYEAKAREIISLLKVGDILLTYNKAQISNLFIEGKYKHAAIFTHGRSIVEAVSPKVKFTSLFDFLMTKDKIALMRAKIPELERAKVAYFAIDKVNKEYDFLFDQGNSERYFCSELVYDCYSSMIPEFDLRNRKGVKTVTPNDFYLARKYFEVILEC